jgi:hypothetical protein
MHILASFLLHSKYGFCLPSEKTISGNTEYDQKLGIFDTAVIGQYIFGSDPRRNNFFVRNRQRFMLSLRGMDMLRMEHITLMIDFSHSAATAKLETTGQSYLIRNLHIHSKIFDQIANPKRLQYILKRFNAGKSTVIYCDIIKAGKILIVKVIGYKYWRHLVKKDGKGIS